MTPTGLHSKAEHLPVNFGSSTLTKLISQQLNAGGYHSTVDEGLTQVRTVCLYQLGLFTPVPPSRMRTTLLGKRMTRMMMKGIWQRMLSRTGTSVSCDGSVPQSGDCSHVACMRDSCDHQGTCLCVVCIPSTNHLQSMHSALMMSL